MKQSLVWRLFCYVKVCHVIQQGKWHHTSAHHHHHHVCISVWSTFKKLISQSCSTPGIQRGSSKICLPESKRVSREALPMACPGAPKQICRKSIILLDAARNVGMILSWNIFTIWSLFYEWPFLGHTIIFYNKWFNLKYYEKATHISHFGHNIYWDDGLYVFIWEGRTCFSFLPWYDISPILLKRW